MQIYLITDTITGRRYVGWTSGSLDVRWKGHLRALASGDVRPLYRAMREHGAEAFTIEQLDEADTRRRAVSLEGSWIRKLGTLAPQGFNRTAGQCGVCPGGFPPSAIERIRETSRERWADQSYKKTTGAAVSAAMSAEGRARIGRATSMRWADPAYRDRVARLISEGRRKKSEGSTL